MTAGESPAKVYSDQRDLPIPLGDSGDFKLPGKEKWRVPDAVAALVGFVVTAGLVTANLESGSPLTVLVVGAHPTFGLYGADPAFPSVRSGGFGLRCRGATVPGMSRFTDTMYANAHRSVKGMVTGEPDVPVRHSWGQVHQRARRVAGGLAAVGVGRGDAVAVLAGAPVEIAPTAQGIWMRGGSLTMLHQPTPRTDLQRWATDTMAVIAMIDAKVAVVSEPFLAAAPLLSQQGIEVRTVEQLLDSQPVDPVDTGDDDVALLQLTSGSTGPPKAVRITHRNVVANAEAMFVGANVDRQSDVIVSWLPCFHDMGMTGYLTVPMYFGAELVKVTPLDFLRDVLLWPKLIAKYQGTMTAAPNFAYTILAKRLRTQAQPGEFDLSSLRWALSGAEQVEPADVEDLIDAGGSFGLRPEAIVPGYGMAETTVAVSFSECSGGLQVDEIDADLLATLGRAIPASRGKTRRLASVGRPLKGIEARTVTDDGQVLPARGVGVIEVRGDPVTPGYTTPAGFLAAQDDRGWYDTGDLGYVTETGDLVICGRAKDVIIMAGRNIYPADIERATARVDGVRPGGAVAIRLDAGHPRETFAVAAESNDWQDPNKQRGIRRQIAREVVADVDARPRNVTVVEPGTIPKTPSGKLRRAHAMALVT